MLCRDEQIKMSTIKSLVVLTLFGKENFISFEELSDCDTDVFEMDGMSVNGSIQVADCPLGNRSMWIKESQAEEHWTKTAADSKKNPQLKKKIAQPKKYVANVISCSKGPTSGS